MSMDNRRGPSQPNSNQNGRPPGGIRPSFLWIVLLFALLIGNIWLAPLLQSSGSSNTAITYTTFESLVTQNKVKTITNQGDAITGLFGQHIT